MDDYAELEDSIRRTLRRGWVQPPGPAFTARVMAALPERRASVHRSGLAMLGVSALAAVIAVLAIRTALFEVGPSPDPTAAASAPDGSAAPTIAPSGLVIYDTPQLWELIVPRPAGWLVDVNGTRADFTGQDMYAVGSMGTVPVEEACQPGDPWVCTTGWDESAAIQVRFEHVGAGPGRWSQWGMASREPPAGAERIRIDGIGAQVRAVDGEQVPGTDEVVPGAARILLWNLPSPGSLWTGYRITAVIRGDSVRADALEQQVRDVVDGIRYAPPFEWNLPADDPVGAIRAGLKALRSQAARTETMDASCFPDVPGERREAVIDKSAFLGYVLTRPLAVTCSSQIEPTEFRRWKMTLRYDWVATDEYDAGHAEMVVLLDKVAGEVGYGGDFFGVDEMPYLRRR